MKRALSALTVILILLSAVVPIYGAGASTLMLTGPEAGADDNGYGLYTDLPYVPKYSGELSSQSRVILMDLATGNILIEQNGDVRAYPASTTKIMTAVLLIENTLEDQWDTPISTLQEVNSSDSAKGSQFGLEIGDRPTRRDLLYGLLLPSGCDCAYVVSNLIAGSEEDFVFMMNKRASEIGMNNTGYENSYGLASNGHYTTAEDMATLVRHAMQYPLFRSICATPSKTLNIRNGSGVRTITTYNTNYLLRTDSPYYYSYAIGVKTGTATIADHCLTSAARKNGLELAAVVMNSDNNSERYTFSREILEWGFRFYASEGGYYSMTLTNALFKAGSGGCGVYAAPDSSQEDNLPISVFPAGAGLRAGAYRYDNNGTLWYMIWTDNGFQWAKSTEMEFVCYVNDIKIETGSALSGVTLAGEDKTVDSVIASRHLVKAVTVTVYDEQGEPVTGGSNYPAASCTHTLAGTTVDNDVDLGILSPGKYTCVTHVEAVAYVPDAPDREYYTVDEKSTILIAADSTGEDADGEPLFDEYVYSYNSNTGSGAPDGGSFRLGNSFKVSDAVPVKPGCVFAGWNTEPDGSGEAFKAGDPVNRQGSVMLYATWAPGRNEWKSDIKASFDDGRLVLTGGAANSAGIVSSILKVLGPNGNELYSKASSGISNAVDASEYAEDLAALELTDGVYTVELTAAVGTGVPEKVFEQTVEVTSRPICTLMFVPNGGNMSSESMTVVCGEPYGELPVPEKYGYVFKGWYDNNEKKIEAETIVPNADNGIIILHANWEDPYSPGSHGNNPGSSSGLAAIPLWVWLAASLLIAAILVVLIVVIIRRPDNGDEAEEETAARE